MKLNCIKDYSEKDCTTYRLLGECVSVGELHAREFIGEM